MAEESNVQTYLTKYKISSLFEVMRHEVGHNLSVLVTILGFDVKSREGITTRSHRFPHKEAANLTEAQEEGMARFSGCHVTLSRVLRLGSFWYSVQQSHQGVTWCPLHQSRQGIARLYPGHWDISCLKNSNQM